MINATSAGIYFQARRFDEAVDLSRKTMEIDPNLGSEWLINVLLQTGRYDDAIVEIVARGRRLGLPAKQVQMAEKELRLGLQKEGGTGVYKGILKLTASSAVQDPEDPSLLFFRGTLFARVGDLDQAFACLEKLLSIQPTYATNIRVDPRFDNLRVDPRYEAICKRLKLS